MQVQTSMLVIHSVLKFCRFLKRITQLTLRKRFRYFNMSLVLIQTVNLTLPTKVAKSWDTTKNMCDKLCLVQQSEQESVPARNQIRNENEE